MQWFYEELQSNLFLEPILPLGRQIQLEFYLSLAASDEGAGNFIRIVDRAVIVY